MKAKSLNVWVVAILAILAANAARAQVTNFFQAVTNLNPAAYWPLQETAQPPQADVETNLGSIGAVANAYYSSTNAFKGAPGVAAGYAAVDFIGGILSGSFLGVPNTSPQISVPVGPFSVEAWVNPSNVTANLTIMAQAGLTATPGLNGAASGAGWSLNQNFDPYTGQNTPGWSFHVYNGQNIYGGADALVATNYATNTWYHLVGVFDGTNATLYVNGVNVTTVGIPMAAGTSYVPDTWDLLEIGAGRGENENQYVGEIEEAAIYTNALTQVQITQDFNAISGSSSSYASTILSDHPYMYWRMNSPANNIAQPVSAYPVAVNYGLIGNLNGLYSSTATPGMPGPAYAGLTNGFNASGLACAFNGMGDDSTNLVTIYTNGVAFATQTINAGVLITNLPNPLNVISNSFSLIYWFKCNPMDDRRNAIIGHSDSNWRASLLANQVTANAGKGGDTSASFNEDDGNWHFVAFVYTNTGLLGPGSFGWAGTNSIYVDGVLKATLALTNASSAGTTTNILIGGAPDKDGYGNGNNSYGGTGGAGTANGSQMFLGSVAHVAFFTNALTAAQVQALYSFAGAPPLIQTQPSPTSFTNNFGTTNVFGKVAASGASNLAYQWYYNSTASYSGATALTDGQTVSGSGDFGSATAELTVTNLGSADAGYYFVVITNNYGSVTSVLSQQQVIQGPIISAQNPSGPFTAYAGQNNLVLSVTALGAGLSYQWFTNGVANTTAGTGVSYPLTVTSGQTGYTFQCVVANVNGSATSAVDTLTTILTVPAGAGNGSFQANLLGLNPVAYWPLQETAQPPAAQIETNYGSLGVNGVAYYSSTNAVAGAPGVTGDGDTAINFKGGLVGSFLAVPQIPGVAVPVGAFSVEAWVYPTNDTASPNIIVAQTGVPGTGGLNGTANSAGWALVQDYVPSTESKLFEGWSFHVFNGQGATGGAEVNVPEAITLNTWYHLVGVFDGTNTYLYIDGTNASPQGDQIPMTGSYIPDTWDQMSIGGLAAAAADADRYYGTLDEVAVYTNALTAVQIANHYAQVNGSYSSTILGDHPYMYWRMDAPAYVQPGNGAYPSAVNYGSAANMNGLYLLGDITGIAGPTNSGLGTSSFGCSINGIGTSSTTNITIFIPNAYGDVTIPAFVTNIYSGILCTNEAPQLCITNQPFTLAAWFKGNPTDNRFQNVVGMHADLGPRFAMSGGQLQFFVGSGGNLVSGTFPNCNDGNWHFGVGVYTNGGSAASGLSSLYVDGILVNTQALTTGLPPDTNFSIMLGADPERVFPGNGGAYNERFLSGSIAHVAYFTNALTGAQILNLYTNATAGVPPVELGVPPTITLQPFPYPSIRQVAGGTFIFEGVTTSGFGVAYQWYFNNTSSNYVGAIGLANNNVKYFNEQTGNMTVSNLVASDSGYYFAVVSNAYGAITSAIVNVQVEIAPIISAQNPSGAFSLYPNQATTLSVTAIGATNQLTYQWFTNSGPGFVADAAAGTTASYAVTAGAPAVSGEMYECIVTNSFGSATSLVDTLTILPFPAGLTNAAYSSNMLVLKPTDYWPMHENESPAPGDIETNYGSLGALGNGYYADWDNNNQNPGNALVYHDFTGALIGDTNPCVSFMGQTNACLVVPHVSPLLTIQPPFTLETWVKAYGAQPKTFGVFMGQGGGAGLNGGANDGGFSFLWNGSPNTFSLTLFNGSGGGNTEPKTLGDYNPGQWYHMVATFDGTNATIYVNGQPTFLQNGSFGSMNPDSWSPLLIGAGRWSTLGPQDPFAGTMDEVAIYTNLLTPDRILQHYNAGSNPGAYGAYFTNILADNPLLYYRMDSPVYTPPDQSTWPVVTNYGTVTLSGVYHPGVVPGGAAGPSPSGMVGTNAMQGNGMGGYVDAGSASALSANPATNNTSFSYTAWFRGHPGEPLGFQGVMSGNDATWRCSINGTGKLQVHGQGSSDLTSALVYNDGNWHQIVLTCVETNTVNKTANTNYLYVDGQLITSFIGVGGNTPAVDPGPEVYIGNEIGFTNAPMGPERCFSADICEAAFFNGIVLSSNQVVALYDSSGQAPYINTQPVSGTVNGNLAFTNSVIAGGVAPLSYQWYQNGVALNNGGNLSGAVSNGVTTESLIINPVGAGNAGSYYVIITNNYGSVTSIVATLNVLTNPVINVQYPVPYTNLYTVFSNTSPSFSVSVIGAVPLTYYWFTNGVGDAAALASTNLTLANVQVSFTNYCIISNSFGTITSTFWSAQVIPDPTNSSGGLAPYPQSVIALHPVGYWRLDDTNEDGVDYDDGSYLGDGDFGWVCHDYVSGNDGLFTNCSLGLPGYNPVSDPADSSAQFGEFDDLGNDFGDSLAFGIQNTSFATPVGNNATFTVEAWAQGFPQNFDSGIVTLGYSGAEQFTLDCGSDSGSIHRFRFFFRDAAGTVHAVSSTVNPSPTGGAGPWYHLAGVVDEVNSNVTFYINGLSVGSTALGTNGLGVLAASRQMSIGSRQGSSTTNYNYQFLGNINDVAIYNYALSANQILNQYLVSGLPPFFAQPPTASTNASGNGAMVIPAVAYGTGPLTAWWTDVNAGTNILTLTTNGTIFNAGLTVSNVPGGWNNDQLELTVSNSYGGTNVFVALNIFTNAPLFTVGLPPQINLALSQSYTYLPVVLGAAPLVYQWYSNNVAIAGATNITYTAAASSAGQIAYSLVVTNIYGSATGVSTAAVYAAPTNNYSAYLLGLSPAGYWPLQETSAPAPATIETNYGTLGALGNAYYAVTTANETNVLFNQPGALAGSGDNDDSVQFDGPSGTNFAFVPRVSPALTMQGPMTYEAWINSGNSVLFCDIMGEGGNGENSAAGGGTFGGIRMSYAGNNTSGGSAAPELQVYIYNSSGNNTYSTIGTTPNSLPLNSGWHHCVMTYNGTTVVLYIDGVQMGSGTTSLNVDTWSPLTIGDARWQGSGSGPTRPYYGLVDDVAVYTNVLSAARVLAHYQAGSASSGSNYVAAVTSDDPLLYYRMDSPGYTNVPASLCPDAVNFGSAPTNGTYLPGTRPGVVAGPPIVTLGTNVASPINGITACIDAGYNSAFNPTNHFTALGWFKSNPADARIQDLMSHGNNWALILNGTNGGTVRWTNSAGSVISKNNLNDGNWHFMAGVYDGTNNYLYVDGALNNEAAAPGVISSDTSDDLYLGGSALYTSVGINQAYFAGAVAQAAFFTNALTAAQIQQLYTLATVVQGLRVSLGPPGVTVYAGQSVTLNAQASGTQPFYYQWYQGGSPIANATNATYTAMATLVPASYYCTVTNSYNGFGSTNAGPVTLTGIAAPTTSYQATVLGNNPIAFWRLNEGPDNGSGNNGTIAYDYAGGHNGAYANVQLGLPGLSAVPMVSTDTAALFGPSNNVNAAINSYAGELYNDGMTPISFAQPAGSNAELSVEAWVNATNVQIAGAGIVAKGFGGGGEQFDLDLSGDDFRFFVRDASGGVHGPTSTVSPVLGQWDHVVGVFDGANGAVHLYVNGVDVADTTGLAAGLGLLTASTTNTALPQAAYVSIGARTSSQAVNNYDLQFQGAIDDVALYNYALTPAQVAADYQAGVASGVPSFTNAPPIAFSVANKNQLVLSWPTKYAGYYYLEVQTNSLATGISNNWYPVGGSSAATLNVNAWTNSINPTNGCVFYRLITNGP